MSRWFRFYDDAVNDPKVLMMPEALRWQWVAMLCVASKNGGKLPSIAAIAISLRISEKKADNILRDLAARGLMDETDGGEGMAPHNWNGRQYKSDVSNERVKRYRERKCNVTEAVTVTPPETEQNTETENVEATTAEVLRMSIQRIPIESKNLPEKYAFDGKIIRLSQKDFSSWTKAFPALDLRGELVARDAWLASDRATEADRKNWYVSTSKYLANRNAEAKAKLAAMQSKPQQVGIAGII